MLGWESCLNQGGVDVDALDLNCEGERCDWMKELSLVKIELC